VSVSNNDVVDSSGESDVLNRLGHSQDGKGGDFRGLVNDTVSSSQCRSEFPLAHKEGEVPGGNQSDDSVGFSSGVVEVVTWLGEGLSGDLISPSGEVSQTVDDFEDV